MSPHRALLLLSLLLPVAVLAGDPPPADVVIGPGEDAYERIQEALILAQPGQVIELSAGRYELERSLSLSVDRVTLRGVGGDQTVLSFAKQTDGSEGLLITGSGCTLADLQVTGTPGDAVKVQGAKGITLRDLQTVWPGEPKAENGGYGLYPVQCQDVLIEGCLARGASDAGIYVGQSRRVVVRGCRAEGNVAGIEIENSRQVDVTKNTATGNTGGILVFDLPGLPVKGGGQVRVFENHVQANQTPNFAPPGNTVALVPRGTGILVMANRQVEVFKNRVGEHATTNVLIVSYLSTGLPLKDPDYDPFPAAVHVHDNTFGPCGDQPDGLLGAMAKQAAGGALPSVVWDGVRRPPADGGEEAPPTLALHDNGEAESFVDLDLATFQRDPQAAHPSRDAAPWAQPLPALPPVELGKDAQ